MVPALPAMLVSVFSNRVKVEEAGLQEVNVGEVVGDGDAGEALDQAPELQRALGAVHGGEQGVAKVLAELDEPEPDRGRFGII